MAESNLPFRPVPPIRLVPPIPLNRQESESAVRLDANNNVVKRDRNLKLEDWLNDKFQTVGDFDELDNLLVVVEKQRSQLSIQLEDAKSKVAQMQKISDDHTAVILEQTEEFKKEHEAANKRLMMVTGADTPDEAIRRLEEPMEKLRRVELAMSYIETLKDVEDLANEAVGKLPDNPKDALIPYKHLKHLSKEMRHLYAATEGAGTHLLEYVGAVSTQLWENMAQIMSDEFQAVLDKAKWPLEDNPPSREWMDSFEKLLDLQYPELVDAEEPLILLPIAVLARPFIQQFNYNFYGTKPTSNPHNLGDHIFPWFLGTLKKWEPFFRESVATILAAHFRGTALGGISLYVDAISAFITALLPSVKEKLDSVMDILYRDPRLISKLISQLLDFDDTLRSTFAYDGGNLDHGWKGLTWTLLDTHFDKWLQVEKKFALQRYNDIIKSPDGGQIDYDSATVSKAKPTFGAIQVVDLVSSVKGIYKRVHRFSHTMQLIVEIQAEILDQYRGRLSDSLDAYETIVSPIARTLQGVTKEEREGIEGVRGLESLCKVYGSSDCVLDALKEWSNNSFFVMLWDELQEKARDPELHDKIAGDLSYSVIKEVTSRAAGSDEEGGIWDESISEYTELRDRTTTLLTEALKHSYPVILKQYFQKAQWMTVGADEDFAPAISSELDQPLRKIRESLDFLNKALGPAEYRRISRQTFKDLEALLWREVLMKQDYTTLGAKQFKQDVQAFEAMAHGSSSASSTIIMHRLIEGAELLNLPVFNDSGPSLIEAARAFSGSDRESAAMLESFKFAVLSGADARYILHKRREAAE